MFSHNCLGFTSFAFIVVIAAVIACICLPKMAPTAPGSLSPLDPSSYSRPGISRFFA